MFNNSNDNNNNINYIIRLGVHVVYLSTIDKQEFYSKLGYVRCQPVSIYGSYSGVINKLTTTSVILPSRKTYMKKQLT